jgi:plasmid stability protein
LHLDLHDATIDRVVPSLTIRNIPEAQLRWLRARAEERGRSLNAELLDVLAVARADELAARSPKNAFARSLLRARALGVRTKPTSARILRRDRDAGA